MASNTFIEALKLLERILAYCTYPREADDLNVELEKARYPA